MRARKSCAPSGVGSPAFSASYVGNWVTTAV
jgi:hypothetical protein